MGSCSSQVDADAVVSGEKELVLVTGISGYLAAHVAQQFLKAGYKVRGTVRSLKDEKKVKPIREAAGNFSNQLELVETDLLNADCWKSIVKDCSLVIHVASPFPLNQPENEDLILKPAINGTINVLKACIDTKVRRVVVTSSGLAMFGAKFDENRTYSEKDWGEAEGAYAYCKSKILAEKAAWDFVADRKKNGQKCFELAVINPTFILGPPVNNSEGTSMTRFISVLEGRMEKVPELYLPTCDVRDVALAHYKAATLPQAAGERIAVASEQNFIPMLRWAQILDKEFSTKGFKIPLEQEGGSSAGKTARVDNTKMKQLLGIKPTDFNNTIIDMANRLIEKGIVNQP